MELCKYKLNFANCFCQLIIINHYSGGMPLTPYKWGAPGGTLERKSSTDVDQKHLFICREKLCCSATVDSERQHASASAHSVLTFCGVLSRLPQIRLRFLPVSSYIQTVKVKVLIVELDSGNSPIIPVRFLFYTTYPAARLQSNYAKLLVCL